MDWLAALTALRERGEPGVLVTLIAVRGHAPRVAGAKMLIAADRTWDSVGGGNLEETAVDRARTMMAEGVGAPETLSLRLSDKAHTVHGIQCCGGEVTMLLEPIAVRPSVVLFGMGHVGLETALILSRHDLRLTLVDSRADQLDEHRLAVVRAGRAIVDVRRAPVPESVLPELPAGTLALILTHDHAEDLALCASALHSDRLGYIGLIGSAVKWVRFTKRLTEAGFTAADLARITTPIGIDGIRSKEPAAIAVSVAADLLMRLPVH